MLLRELSPGSMFILAPDKETSDAVVETIFVPEHNTELHGADVSGLEPTFVVEVCALAKKGDGGLVRGKTFNMHPDTVITPVNFGPHKEASSS